MDRIGGRTATPRGGARWRSETIGRPPAANRPPAPPPEARARAIVWAIRLADDPRTVYLDTETTGLGGRAEVVDVAVAGGDGRILFETLVRPLAPIPPDATAIHGIADADVADAPGWPAVHDELCRLLTGRLVVVYNAAFDRRIVTQCGERHGLALPELDWHCAMRRFAEFHGDWDAARGVFRWQKLEQAVAVFGVAPGGHRAAADALACRAVVLGMAGLL